MTLRVKGDLIDLRGKTKLNWTLDKIERLVKQRTPRRTFGRIQLHTRWDTAKGEPGRVLTVLRTGEFELRRGHALGLGPYLPPVLGRLTSAELAALRLELVKAKLGELVEPRSHSFDPVRLEVTSPEGSLRAKLSGDSDVSLEKRDRPLMKRLEWIVSNAERDQPADVYIGTVINEQGVIAIKGDARVRAPSPSTARWHRR